MVAPIFTETLLDQSHSERKRIKTIYTQYKCCVYIIYIYIFTQSVHIEYVEGNKGILFHKLYDKNKGISKCEHICCWLMAMARL